MKKITSAFIVLSLLVGVSGLLPFSRVIRAESAVNSNTWITDGPVYAIVSAPSATYIGGQFTYVGPNTGSGVPLSASTGEPLSVFPKITGAPVSVNAVLPDGSGGWYVGGEFSKAGGASRNNFAHILADSTLDLAFNPNVIGAVRAIAASGGTVYLGGDFTNVSGQGRSRLAALDSAGNLTSFNVSVNGTVNALTLNSDGSTLYIGGSFSNVGGNARANLAAIETATGNVVAWTPNPDGTALSLTVSADNATLYVGGMFTNIGGAARNYIAALNTGTGAATAWDPDADDAVNAIALNGTTLLVGGVFANIGGQARQYIAALDTTVDTINATAWDPDADDFVNALAVDGAVVYAGGFFTSIGSQTRNKLAALDIATGNAAAWNPNPQSTVNAVAVSGGTVFAGGDFASIGGRNRSNIAALNADGSVMNAWNPGANNTVFSMALLSSVLYVGGDFTNIGGQARNRLAAMDAASGAANAPFLPDVNGTVNALAADAVSGKLYLAGSFTSVNTQARNYIAAVDLNGNLLNWNPNAANIVLSLAVDPGASRVYAAGIFTNIGGLNRNNIAALDASVDANNAVASWDANADTPVFALALDGSTLYAAGTFSNIGGQTRSRLAGLSVSDGAASSWNPNVVGGVANAVAVNGNAVYIGGTFTGVGGNTRNNLAQVGVADGAVSAWNPNPGNQVRAIAANGSSVYAGGDFTVIGSNQVNYFARFDFPTVQFDSAASNVAENSGTVNVNLSLSAIADFDISVGYSVTGGSADAGDYTLVSGTAVVSAGNTSASIPVQITDEGSDESDETIVITLSNPIGGVLGGNAVHTLTIGDNDEPPAPPSGGGGGGGGGGLPPGAFNPPTPPPQGWSVFINDGAALTNARNVALKFNAGPDIKKMAVSNFSNFSDSFLEDYTSSREWVLTPGNGEKTVYVKFLNAYNQPSPVVSDSIALTEQAVLPQAGAPAQGTPGAGQGQVLGAATFEFTRNLGKGMRGNDVTELQKKLTAEGVYSGPVTGYFGDLTLAGVKAYQKKLGLVETGIAGPVTRLRLNGETPLAGISLAVNARIKELQAKTVELMAQLINLLFIRLESLVR